MIYHIDNKEWRLDKLKELLYDFDKNFLQYIKILNIQEAIDLKEEILQKATILIFHKTISEPILMDFRNSYLTSKRGILIEFSGSTSSEVDITKDNHIKLHYQLIEKNIKDFLEAYKNDNINIKILALGKNFKKEDIFDIQDRIFIELLNLKAEDLINKEFFKEKLEILTKRFLVYFFNEKGVEEDLEKTLNQISEKKLNVSEFKIDIKNRINQIIEE